LFLAPEVRAGQNWNPKKTWVFVVGVLEWKDATLLKPFPKEGRKDAELVRAFRARGVPARQITYLQDRRATRTRIQQALVRQLSRTRKGDLFFLYYAGHGCRDIKTRSYYFANYDAGRDFRRTAWSMPSVFHTIETHFRGSQAILTSDCCHSGALVVEAKRRRTAISYGIIAAAHYNSFSTGRWTFTECLLDGLRGEAAVDSGGDGHVTFAKLARYTQAEMAFLEDQVSVYTTTNQFDSNLVLARAAQKASPLVGRHVEVKWQGNWYRAKIEAVQGKQYKIHYNHHTRDWDEWVGPDRIRAFEPRHLAKGTKVRVEWYGKWYAATVLAGWYGLHYIRYDEDPEYWNEWVASNRIRR
jgi:hypothetical protein